MSARISHQTRSVLISDVPALVDLLLQAHREDRLVGQMAVVDREQLTSQICGMLGEPGSVIGICVDGDQVVGLVAGRHAPKSAFTAVSRLHLEAVFVDAKHRRLGVGHSLMTYVVEIAQAAQVEEIISFAVIGGRAVQRFYARLGFAPFGSRRVITTEHLARKLGIDGSVPSAPVRSAAAVRARRGRRSSVDGVIAKRRASRLATGEMPIVQASVPSK